MSQRKREVGLLFLGNLGGIVAARRSPRRGEWPGLLWVNRGFVLRHGSIPGLAYLAAVLSPIPVKTLLSSTLPSRRKVSTMKEKRQQFRKSDVFEGQGGDLPGFRMLWVE